MLIDVGIWYPQFVKSEPLRDPSLGPVQAQRVKSRVDGGVCSSAAEHRLIDLQHKMFTLPSYLARYALTHLTSLFAVFG